MSVINAKRCFLAFSGGFSRKTGLSIGYLEQHACRDSENTAEQEALTVFSHLQELQQKIDKVNISLKTTQSDKLLNEQAALQEEFLGGGGLTYVSRTRATLIGLGFKEGELSHPVSTLSGGERAKIGLAKLLLSEPDLILLDIMLPKMDGFDVCRKIREKLNVPIIMITARDEEVDKVLGLELGADDYITKPFSVRELIARVKANMRRVSSGTASELDDKIYVDDNFVINVTQYEAVKNGVVLDLTLREYELLKFLVTQPNRIFTREALLSSVWGYEFYGDVRTVDVTVRRLREKIEDDPGMPHYIITKRGVGYYFNKAN